MCGGMFKLSEGQELDGLPAKLVTWLDGKDDQSPIRPPQATRQEFEHLLHYIYGEWQSPPYPLDYLIAVLKLSSQWDMAQGRAFAVYNLKQIEKDLPPALRLKLGRIYDLDEWLLPAFHALVFTPLVKLTPQDLHWLGLSAYSLVARVREKAEAERKTLAFIPPSMDDIKIPECTRHEQCIKNWNDLWVSKVGKRVLHPNQIFALKFWQIPHVLEKLDLSGIFKKCGEAVVAKALASGAFEREELLVGQAFQYLLLNVPLEDKHIML
ncbi:hypothetical protein A0H81_09540 [Grifola frondosa]|uniref:BTB domain-containing protein n=1 Tax=Grifola frondosa TaxID=5627 RepID=A0A1C7M2D7_GRIFR|nr:hypothetical protein A0H81_09540 [Grifola frondosa]